MPRRLADLRDAVVGGGPAHRLLAVRRAARARRADLVEGAQIRGAAAFVEEVMAPGAQALVY